MPIKPHFSSIFSIEQEINFTQCTPNGYLKYTELCNLLQLAAAAHSEIGGISFTDLQLFHQAWVLSRMRVEIKALPKWKDTIRIKTWINSFENSRSVRALEMYINDTKIVGSETFWVVFNTQTRRPEPLTLPYQHFEIYPEKRATELSFIKINTSHEKEVISERTVFLSDLDIVNHVNNIKYLEWCLDLIEGEKIATQQIKSFEMNFLKELSLKDKAIIHQSVHENDTVFLFSAMGHPRNIYE